MPVGVVPQRHGALLDDEDVLAVRLPLPQDEIVRLVKLDAAASGEEDDVGFFHGLEGRMCLEEIGNAVADSGCFHVG